MSKTNEDPTDIGKSQALAQQETPPQELLKQLLVTAREHAEGAKAAADAAKAATEAIGALKKQADESLQSTQAALAEIQSKLAEVSAFATQAVAANTKIADHQAVVATKSDHIQKAQEHADKVRGDLDRALTAANQQLVAIEGEQNKAQVTAEKASTSLASLQASTLAAETAAGSAVESQKIAASAATATKSLADKAAIVEKRITDYESQLQTIDDETQQKLATINELLRGATSAGLASAFDKRRETFLKPNTLWQWIFVGSVLFLVLLTLTGLIHVYRLDKVPEWGELARLWVTRLPIAGALIWLALHASREAALAKRLEEDYGYKAAIAACFEGFRKQMSDIDIADSSNSQLGKLCENTLATIASPPGRIYAAHKLVVSPTDEIGDVAKAAVSVSKAITTPKS